ncbi:MULTISPECIES: YbbR-like domain-containing protein [Aestuariibaculum]|uniref:YbbR-like domain-containing protein n=1 Tax=Aestuariibaculum lutulentum TaxID=2920935 RepID=A0ABS9RJ60_9FLAO|nr:MULTISPECIES: YbbR-like domain-containing protein [Aestuariibaculum]MCH4552991.1 YbbR-like domain-containing protein [Aestuariibaculum lutulentum]MCR8669115.1 YbbR-like domain-containing protein [Aestuariibaculum sp. M13]
MLKELKSKILASIKSKRLNVFVLFLLSAFLILLFNKLSKEYTNTLAFNIKAINVPDEDVILNDSIRLDVTLKTHGFKWLKYYFSKPEIKVDFKKDIYKKDSVFVWHKTAAYLQNTQFSSQVSVLNITPDTLYFQFDENMVKKVPVVLQSDIKYSPGYDLASDFNLKPDSITVIGPEIKVSKIHYIETESLALKDVRTDLLKTVKLKLPVNNQKHQDVKFSAVQTVLNAKVDKFTEGILKIPVQLINAPENVRLKFFPKEVNVAYYVSLSDFNTITAKDFKVVCDFSKTINNQFFMVPEVAQYPEKVKNVKINQKRIEFIITK